MQRLLKPLCKRTAVVFLLFLLYTLSHKFLLPAENQLVQTKVTIIDRKYQQMLNSLKDRHRQKLEMYREHITKTGVFAARTDPSLCLQESVAEGKPNNVITVAKCDATSEAQIFTMDRYRNSENPDTISRSGKCIDIGTVNQETGVPLILYGCHGGGTQTLTYDYTAGIIYHAGHNKCVDRKEVGVGELVKALRCNLLEEGMKWDFREKDGSS